MTNDTSNQVELAHLLSLVTEIRGDLTTVRQAVRRSGKPLLTVEEVADMTGRSPYTVRRWVKLKRIDAIRVTGSGPKGRLLVPRDELSKLFVHGLGQNILE